MKCLRLAALPIALSCSSAHAAEQAGLASTGNLLRVLLGLVAVLALMAAAAWLLRRSGVAAASSYGSLRLVGGLSIGARERILVVEVASQWIVVGVAPAGITALSTLPRQETAAPDAMPAPRGFPAWLQQMMDKRNGR